MLKTNTGVNLLNNKKIKHPKMDRHLININEPYEVQWVITRMAKYAVKVTAKEVKAAVKAVGISRRKVYAYLSKS